MGPRIAGFSKPLHPLNGFLDQFPHCLGRPDQGLANSARALIEPVGNCEWVQIQCIGHTRQGTIPQIIGSDSELSQDRPISLAVNLKRTHEEFKAGQMRRWHPLHSKRREKQLPMPAAQISMSIISRS